MSSQYDFNMRMGDRHRGLPPRAPFYRVNPTIVARYIHMSIWYNTLSA